MPKFHLMRFLPVLLCAAMIFDISPAGLAQRHEEPVVTTAAARIKHIFVIMLENKTFSNTFGNSTQDPYLQGKLVPPALCSPSTTAPAM